MSGLIVVAGKTRKFKIIAASQPQALGDLIEKHYKDDWEIAGPLIVFGDQICQPLAKVVDRTL